MSKYVLSTLTNSFKFIKYGEKQHGGFAAPVLRTVRIAGGANRPNLRGFGEMAQDQQGVPMWTPSGMITAVSDEDMAWLEENESFMAFVNNGNLLVLDSDPGDSHKKIKGIVMGDMSEKDSHAPMTPNDNRGKIRRIVVGNESDGDRM